MAAGSLMAQNPPAGIAPGLSGETDPVLMGPQDPAAAGEQTNRSEFMFAPKPSPEQSASGPGTGAAPEKGALRPAWSRTDSASAADADEALDRRTEFLLDAGADYAEGGEYEEAETAFLRALAGNPGNPKIRFQLSTLYIKMERYKEAARLLNELAGEFPDNPMVHNNLAWIYATGGEMKNGPLALSHAREALLFAPFAPSVWNTLAEAYYISGDYGKALRSSIMALDLLQKGDPPEEEVRDYQAQQTKIRRAEQAFSVLENQSKENH